MSNPVRILHVLGGLNAGGAETFVMNLYRVIDKDKIQFDFIKHTSEKQFYDDEILELGGRIFSCPKYTGANHFLYIAWWHRFFTLHPEYQVLHSHVRSTAATYIPIAKRRHVKTISHSHATSNGNGIKSMVKYILQFPLRYQADYFFACSREAGLWLFGSGVVNSKRFYIINNSIDAARFRFDMQIRTQYRTELQLDNKIVYIHVGRFHPSKNHLFLLDTFDVIRHHQPNSVLLLVGDGPLRPEIEAQISKLNLSESVVILGQRDDVSKLFQASDCFLFPSKWEGLPLATIEAQASGLPCICSCNMSNLANISQRLVSLPLEKELWVRAAIEFEPERKDTYDQIVAAGFDVFTTTKWLEQFYLNLLD